MKVSTEQIKSVKGLGCLYNRGSEDLFSVRIITKNGTMNAEQLQNVAEAAEKFGNGRVAITCRLSIELQGVPFDKITALRDYLTTVGLETGGTGDKVRPIACCKGTTCIFGRIDTQAIALMIHERFYEGWKDIQLPYKFKIAVGGCPNNCMKPDLNDFGIIGNHKKNENGDGENVKVVIGGKWGRRRREANEIPGTYSVNEAMALLEKALLVYRKLAYVKERFGDMIDRIGFENVSDMICGDDIIKEKQDILDAEIQKRP